MSEAPSATRPWDPGRYDREHGYVTRYGLDVVELLEPRPGERVLDVGCGTGHLTAKIADAGAAVVGIDLSESMIEEARRAYPSLAFEVADAAGFRATTSFDAVFSNAALHWMKPPRAVVAAIARALRPGGRFVAEMGGRGNVAALRDAVVESLASAGLPADPAKHPWYFPSLGEYASLLESEGLAVTFARGFERPTPIDGGRAGLRSWLDVFAGSWLGDLNPADRDRVADDVERRLEPTRFRDGTWVADYRRLRFVAVRGA